MRVVADAVVVDREKGHGKPRRYLQRFTFFLSAVTHEKCSPKKHEMTHFVFLTRKNPRIASKRDGIDTSYIPRAVNPDHPADPDKALIGYRLNTAIRPDKIRP